MPFIDAIRKEIIEGHIIDGEYCILMYITIYDHDKIKAIFKNIDEFEKRYQEEISKIDPLYGISFQIWYFD